MRTIFAGAALAALVAGCAPEADKTNPAVATEEAAAERAAAAPAAGATSFTQEQARERATSAGYMDVGELTQIEVADALGVSRKTVKVRLAKFKLAVQRLLHRRAPAERMP